MSRVKLFPWWSFFIICITFMENAVVFGDFLCPKNETIAPCSCHFNEYSNGFEIECAGSQVTQDVLSHLFKNLWVVNFPDQMTQNQNQSQPQNITSSTSKISENILDFHKLTISQTPIKNLNLSPLFQTRLNKLHIYGNLNLTDISGTDSVSVLVKSEEMSILLVEQLYIGLNPLLTDEGMNDTLKYFDPNVMTTLTISGSKIEGSLFSSEFLPGLSNFIQLTSLSLGDCAISRVGPRAFQKNVQLRDLWLGFNNMTSVEKDAFLFDEPPPHFLKERINLILSFNRISDVNFSGKTAGLEGSPRPIFLSLASNQFEYLNETEFKGFLLKHPTNQVELGGNPLMCDERMQWLKERRDVFEYLVLDARCQNDPGFTVWDSDLIPSQVSIF